MKDHRALLHLSAWAVAAATAITLNISAASAAKNCASSAECACQIALESGSRASLRLFHQLYPKSDTICGASASTSEPPIVGQGRSSEEGSRASHASSTPSDGNSGGGSGSDGDGSSSGDSGGNGDSVDSGDEGDDEGDDNSDGSGGSAGEGENETHSKSE